MHRLGHFSHRSRRMRAGPAAKWRMYARRPWTTSVLPRRSVCQALYLRIPPTSRGTQSRPILRTSAPPLPCSCLQQGRFLSPTLKILQTPPETSPTCAGEHGWRQAQFQYQQALRSSDSVLQTLQLPREGFSQRKSSTGLL